MRNLWCGIISGLAASVVFSPFLIKKGLAPVAGELIHLPTKGGGLAFLAIASIIIGLGFAKLVTRIKKRLLPCILLGLTTGAVLWLVTLFIPPFETSMISELFSSFSTHAISYRLSSLLALLVFGLTLSSVYWVLSNFTQFSKKSSNSSCK